MLSTKIRRQICSNNKRYLKRKKKITSRKIRARIVKIVAEKLQKAIYWSIPTTMKLFESNRLDVDLDGRKYDCNIRYGS